MYLTLGALLARFATRRRTKVYLLTVALLTTFVVGASRVYLGVHYPSDVLAGWCAGLIWALTCWLVARYLQYRGVAGRATQTRAGLGRSAASGPEEVARRSRNPGSGRSS